MLVGGIDDLVSCNFLPPPLQSLDSRGDIHRLDDACLDGLPSLVETKPAFTAGYWFVCPLEAERYAG